jgi:hypothetical protein
MSSCYFGNFLCVVILKHVFWRIYFSQIPTMTMHTYHVFLATALQRIYKDLKNLHPSEIRTRDLLFWRLCEKSFRIEQFQIRLKEISIKNIGDILTVSNWSLPYPYFNAFWAIFSSKNLRPSPKMSPKSVPILPNTSVPILHIFVIFFHKHV